MTQNLKKRSQNNSVYYGEYCHFIFIKLQKKSSIKLIEMNRGGFKNKLLLEVILRFKLNEALTHVITK